MDYARNLFCKPDIRIYNIMISKLLITIFAILFILFLLSVFCPKDSQKGFCVLIHKIRRGMDRCCYWFFKLYIAVIILFIACMMIRRLL